MGNNERHAGGLFVVGMLAPKAMVAEMPAVVAPKNNDGIFGQATLF